jgi:hypothetical protein
MKKIAAVLLQDEPLNPGAATLLDVAGQSISRFIRKDN